MNRNPPPNAGCTLQIRPAEPTFGTVKTAGSIKSVGLSSSRQFQRLEFKDGKAEALTGTYQVRDVTLEMVDSDGQRWNTSGRYRPTGPSLSTTANQETTLSDVARLTIRVAVLPTSETGVIELSLICPPPQGPADRAPWLGSKRS
jgi:hypothetical protein